MVCGKFSSVINCNGTELVLNWLDQALLRAELVFYLFRNWSNAVVVVTTLGDWLLLLLLLFSPYLGAAVVVVSNTLGVVAEFSVISLFGGENIFVNCSIASFTIVPCCKNGIAQCGCCNISMRSSVALANPSVVAVVGMSAFSWKNSIVFVVRITLVSGM
jgi:hypothetical protein